MTTSAPPTRRTDAQQEFVRELAELLPEQGEWSEEAYLWLTNHTNHLVEFSDGHIEVLLMPTQKHQAISKFLFLAFLTFVQRIGGNIFYAPLRIRLKSGKFREPDLVLVLDANDRRCHNEYWDGADLVVEIVSPDDPNRDLVKKRKEYAQADIAEYWIVNPQTETITVLRLGRTRYAEHGVFGRGAAATSALLAGFEVSVDAVFDAE